MLEQVGPLLLGILMGVALTVCFGFPRVGRAIGKIGAVALMAAGAGFLTWGLLGMLSSQGFEAMVVGPILFSTAAQTLGWGAGCLCGGITALVLTSLGGK